MLIFNSFVVFNWTQLGPYGVSTWPSMRADCTLCPREFLCLQSTCVDLPDLPSPAHPWLGSGQAEMVGACGATIPWPPEEPGSRAQIRGRSSDGTLLELPRLLWKKDWTWNPIISLKTGRQNEIGFSIVELYFSFQTPVVLEWLWHDGHLDLRK